MPIQKTVQVGARSRFDLLHVEAPGCIVNIRHRLHDAEGRAVTHVSIEADGDRCSGDPVWWLEGERGFASYAVRVINGEVANNEPSQVHAALAAAEAFVVGFEGDELQAGIPALLAQLRAAIKLVGG